MLRSEIGAGWLVLLTRHTSTTSSNTSTWNYVTSLMMLVENKHSWVMGANWKSVIALLDPEQIDFQYSSWCVLGTLSLGCFVPSWSNYLWNRCVCLNVLQILIKQGLRWESNTLFIIILILLKLVWLVDIINCICTHQVKQILKYRLRLAVIWFYLFLVLILHQNIYYCFKI